VITEETIDAQSMEAMLRQSSLPLNPVIDEGPFLKTLKQMCEKTGLSMGSFFGDELILDRNDEYFIYHAKLDEAKAAGLTDEQIKLALEMGIQMLKSKTPPK